MSPFHYVLTGLKYQENIGSKMNEDKPNSIEMMMTYSI